MGMSDVLKVFKIALAVGECNLNNFQNIMSDHKSRNPRAVHVIFAGKVSRDFPCNAIDL